MGLHLTPDHNAILMTACSRTAKRATLKLACMPRLRATPAIGLPPREVLVPIQLAARLLVDIGGFTSDSN